MMVHGGNGDGGRVELQIGCQQFLGGRKNRDRVFGGGLGRAGAVRLDGRNQSNAEASGFQLAIDAQMVPAKGAGSGNGNAQRGFAHC